MIASAIMEQVQVTRRPVRLPTYPPLPPDKNPMFLEKRVYQGSSGKVYPLPFIDRISETKRDVEWDAIHLENEFLYCMILPQIGGRIHILRDKTNGYDAIYNQPVIKPALVGLAGPWISGGIEFNWPQHHRPSTFMPAEAEIERHDDGAVTIWLGEHDPMQRMKGMHGVCLRPGCAYLELKARVYNRTPLTQTFLWWANAATRVHEAYQSFFPPDVTAVADHAKRATSAYPLCEGRYYGVDYKKRGRRGIPKTEIPSHYIPGHAGVAQKETPGYRPNDLSWYANIPVPTSYMCTASREDFFGGYDYNAQAGLVHIADRHVAPGKKQWTWGNHEFGYAWDRNLTDPDAEGEHAPYIELMAGAFTDNQPDFSFLQPGETKTWTQYWYPIQKIGAAQHANLDAAVSLQEEKDRVRFGVSVTRAFVGARIELKRGDDVVFAETLDLAPGNSFVRELAIRPLRKKAGPPFQLSVSAQDGHTLITYSTRPCEKLEASPAAKEPLLPAEIASLEELYLTGLHLEQYRHATRDPTLYWSEALRRDPLDSRCNNAIGLWHLRRGEFAAAEKHFRSALKRLTVLNPNPNDGEPSYNLGLCLRYLGRDEEAYDAFYKAVWNQAWQAAGYHALAEIDCMRVDWAKAIEHLDRSLRWNVDNLRARNLKALALRRLGRDAEAVGILDETLARDPLDAWARYLKNGQSPGDTQVALDVAVDFAGAGFTAEAIELLKQKTASCDPGTEPMLHYTLGWLQEKKGDLAAARVARRTAQKATPDYCFPARLLEIEILESAIRADSSDARACYYLGNLFYDRRRHREAIQQWERAVRLEPANAVAWRNLGIAYYNIVDAPARARAAYDRAVKANPADARLLYERDQLWKRMKVAPVRRLAALQKNLALVGQRDDLSIELGELYNQVGRHEDARHLLESRRFQPWEGGEGQVLGQHARTHLAFGRRALRTGNAEKARAHFETALMAPINLGEARHLLANQSDIHYGLGCALAELGDKKAAVAQWTAAANFKGDFQEMSVKSFSEMTYYSALAWEKLGRTAKAKALFRDLLAYAKALKKQPAKIDYFATSLPTLLLFDEDLSYRQTTSALFLEAQALLGLRLTKRAKEILHEVLRRDPNHALARDLEIA